MDKMLVITFNTERSAYEGLDALKDLEEKGDVALYATAVLTKDKNGKVIIKQSADQGPIMTAIGMLTGTAMGMFAGPAGAAIGATVGSMVGTLSDVENLGANSEFIDNVSELLIPGKTVVLAEIEEDWVTPVDTKMAQLGGHVMRQPRFEVIEDQLDRESAAFSKEMKEIREEMKENREGTKAALQKSFESLKERLTLTASKIDVKLNQVNQEAQHKVKTLQDQMKNVSEEKKTKLEKRIAEIKADQKMRSEKLHKANKLIKEALIG
jgi:uncharacterized membrane protein